ncbi:MAG: phytanoyl-CoA dioxygenase family protein [Solirubrobacterales bacterium]|nr:phytanoyl-CoA dioxygenase family protein [Solirubrobacterales bacterium]
MGLLSRVRRRESSDATASVAALQEEIARLQQENRRQPDRARERRLLELRHAAGMARTEVAPGSPEYAEPDPTGLRTDQPIPEVDPAALTSGNIRAGILQAGCVLVRGLIPSAEASAFAQEIERAWAARDRSRDDAGPPDGYYEEFTQKIGTEVLRSWVEGGGGLLAADSPPLFSKMTQLFERVRLPALVEGYLGETPLISLHKSTLRKADPSVPGAWHQDGKFLGDVRALNLWLALSDCGQDAPGLDILPRRLDTYLATGTDDAPLEWTISQKQVDEAAGEDSILRPVFEAGDALLFDELFLHQTASDPAMTQPRYAIESWFFGASQFPPDYAPFAI